MPASPRWRMQSGFTLLEVIVALAVVSLGIIAAFGNMEVDKKP